MGNKDMLWGGKRFNSLDFDLKRRFGTKVAKLALDAGFTCPTRDGSKGTAGCLFCSSRGSGDFTQSGGIAIQMKRQAEIALNKWKSCLFIAYFQSYTNTYAPINILRSVFDEALDFPGNVGLAIATRCDCLPEEILDLIEEYNKRVFVWVELGLQTAMDKTGEYLRRGFKTDDFDDAVLRLERRNILSVVHLIAGLPDEGKKELLASVSHINRLPVWGVKVQMLNILYDSDMYKEFIEKPYRLFDLEDYTETVCDALEIMRSDIVIHRLTGDAKKENLYEPLWTLDKKRVLSEINQEMVRRKSYQGIKYNNVY